MASDIRARMANGEDPSADECNDETEEEQEGQHMAADGPKADDVSGVRPSSPVPVTPALSDWQARLSIRETVIVLAFLGGLIFQYSNLTSQMGQLAHDVTSQSATITAIHQDVATLSAELRTHVESPGHSVSLERIAVLTNRLDDLTVRVKAIETAQWQQQQHR